MEKFNVFQKILGISFIVIGLISYIAPIPGSTLLIILGFVWLIGKKRTMYFFKEVLSKKMFKFLKVRRVIKKI
jgi:hypothetical protein